MIAYEVCVLEAVGPNLVRLKPVKWWAFLSTNVVMKDDHPDRCDIAGKYLLVYFFPAAKQTEKTN